jgi:hypothetical protein
MNMSVTVMPKVVSDARAYAPYDKMTAFWHGYSDYYENVRQSFEGADQQAYDRGLELAMKRTKRA